MSTACEHLFISVEALVSELLLDKAALQHYDNWLHNFDDELNSSEGFSVHLFGSELFELLYRKAKVTRDSRQAIMDLHKTCLALLICYYLRKL